MGFYLNYSIWENLLKMNEKKSENKEVKAFNRDESRESLNRDNARSKLSNMSETEEGEDGTDND